MSAAPPSNQLLISGLAHAELRQQVLGWAVSTAKSGETQDSIVGRATAYLDFITYPLRHQVAVAMVESHGETRQ